jgi:hypothetical protein
MRRALQAAGLVVAVSAATLATTGAASAATATESVSAPRANCSPTIRSRAIPDEWIPRSPAEDDRRLSWVQVRDFDRDHDDRLSDVELRRFRDADILPAGGPRCDRPDNPRKVHRSR